MLFSSLANEGGGFDIEQLIMSMRGEIDPERLRTACEEVGRRHPVLRTAFRWQDVDMPAQDVYEDVLIPFEFKDLSQQPQGIGDTVLKEFLAADRSRGFNLAEPPLTRLSLFRIKQLEYVLVWTFHHLIVDGRSMTLLAKELLQIYTAKESGRQLDLAIPRPFREFVDWQRLTFWRAGRLLKSIWRNALSKDFLPQHRCLD